MGKGQRREGSRGVVGPCSEAKFVEGLLHVIGVDGARLGERGGRQGVVGDAADLPWQSAGGLEQRLDGDRLEQGQFAAGEAQPMGEVVVELVAAEAADVVADDEALAERLVDGHGQPAVEFGESGEQHAQAAFGVHLEVGEEPEILEDVVAQVLGLVDDEDRQLLGLLDETLEARESSARKSRESRCARVSARRSPGPAAQRF